MFVSRHVSMRPSDVSKKKNRLWSIAATGPGHPPLMSMPRSRDDQGQSIMVCSPKLSRATAGTLIAAALLAMLPAGSLSASPRVDGLRREGLTTGMPSLAFAGIQLPACARPRSICHRGSVSNMCKTQKRGEVLGMRMRGGGGRPSAGHHREEQV